MAEKVVLKVTGMSCGHCEMAVNKALMGLDGVKKAIADHKAGQAEVEVEPGKTTREAMIQAVKKAGYEAS